MIRYYYNDQGTITAKVTNSKFLAPSDDPFVDDERNLDPDAWCVRANVLVELPGVENKPVPASDWSSQRKRQYGQTTDQLAALYDDVKNGVFGEQAKQGRWFQHINNIKQKIPKQ